MLRFWTVAVNESAFKAPAFEEGITQGEEETENNEGAGSFLQSDQYCELVIEGGAWI